MYRRFLDLDQGRPLGDRVANSLTIAHQFESHSRCPSISGSDGIFSSDRGAVSSISKVRAVSVRSQVLDSGVGDGRPSGDTRICDGLKLGIDPAVDCECGFSIRHRDRHNHVARDRRVLLDHSLVCLQAGTRHIDRPVPYRSAYTHRVKFAAFVRQALCRFVGADAGAS